jgi:integrase
MSLELEVVTKPERARSLANLSQEYIRSDLANTCLTYRVNAQKIYDAFIAYLHGRKMDEDTLTRYLEYLMKNGHTPNNAKYKMGFIKRLLHWCWKRGYTENRWHEFVPRIRQTPPPEPKVLTYAEYMEVRKHCRSRELEWAIICGWNTGMRMGDVAWLRWAQIDLVNQWIQKPVAKTRWTTGRSTSCPIITGSDMHEWLLDLKENPTQEMTLSIPDIVCPQLYLWHLRGSGVGCHTLLSMRFREIFNRAGLRDKSFKHLRCSFESNLANSGMNLALAAKISGRSDPRSIMRYVKMDQDAARSGVAIALDPSRQLKSIQSDQKKSVDDPSMSVMI